MSAPHPSRSAPLCKDCHHLDDSRTKRQRCNHPSAPVDPVTGEGAIAAQDFREVNIFRERRTGAESCGPEGLLFERNTACATCGGKGQLRQPFDAAPTACPACKKAPGPSPQPHGLAQG